MKKYSVLTATLAMFACTTFVLTAGEIEREELGSSTIKFSECPKAVQKTMTREARGAKIKMVDLECRDDKVVFEADVVIDGRNYEILVTPNGKLLAKVLDEDPESTVIEMKLKDCPKTVQKALIREADGAEIDLVDKMSSAGRDLYEIDVEIDDVNYEIIVTASGVLISKQMDEEEVEEGEEGENSLAKSDEDEDEEDMDEDEDKIIEQDSNEEEINYPKFSLALPPLAIKNNFS